jgi:hypothetical protein
MGLGYPETESMCAGYLQLHVYRANAEEEETTSSCKSKAIYTRNNNQVLQWCRFRCRHVYIPEGPAKANAKTQMATQVFE